MPTRAPGVLMVSTTGGTLVPVACRSSAGRAAAGKGLVPSRGGSGLRFNHSREHPSWFAADGYHLTPTGQSKYAAFLASRTA